MKKGKLFLTILAGLALVACDTPASGTTSSSSKPSISDSTSTSVVEKFNVEVVNGTGGANDVTSGSSITVVANEPEEGKKFVKWVDENGNEVSTEKSYTFVVTKNVKLTATYETLKFQVTITDGTGSGEYDYGASATIQANSAEGKEFVVWVDASGSEVSKENPYTFIVKSDVSLFAEFKDAYANPQNMSALKAMLPKIAKAQANTASMTVKIKDDKYTSMYSVTGTDESVTMYNNAFVSTGFDLLSSTQYPINKIVKKTDTHLLSVNKFDTNKRTSTATAQKIVANVAEGSESKQITDSGASEMVNCYGIVSTLSDLFNGEQCEEILDFNVTDTEGQHVIEVKSVYDIKNYSGYVTIKAYVTTTLTIDDNFYLSSVVIDKKQYVIATQFNDDGTLKDDATPKGTYLASYASEKLVEPKKDLEESQDFTKDYFISDFEFSGRYYDNNVTRYFTSDYKDVPLNQEINISYIEPATDSIKPTTNLENNALILVGISDQSIIRPGYASDGSVDPNKELYDYSSIYTVGLGKCTLTFETTAGLRKDITLTVKEKLPPVSFEVDCAETVLKDEKIELNTKNLKPTSAENDFVWSVSDSKLAEIVIEEGKTYLKGKKTGFVDVIAKAKNDEKITATKQVFVSEGPLPMDEVELLLGGSTWFAEKSTYSHTGFKFEFENDGTFTITDNYRGSTARITGKGTWALTANADSDQTHSSNFTDILGEDYYVIEIENFETTESKGYYVDIHLAIAKDGHALVYHFIPGSTVASTQYGNAKKIA